MKYYASLSVYRICGRQNDHEPRTDCQFRRVACIALALFIFVEGELPVKVLFKERNSGNYCIISFLFLRSITGLVKSLKEPCLPRIHSEAID